MSSVSTDSANFGSIIFVKKKKKAFFPGSSKKQNLNFQYTGNYLHSTYIVLGMINNLEMI